MHLLHLELDGGLEVKDLGVKVIRVRHQGGELSCLVEARAQQPWDLLDEGVGGKESIILLGQSLNLGLVAMLLVSQQANLELLAGNMLQLDSARETLVLLGIVVLQANLEVDRLLELSWLVLGVLHDSMDTLKQSFLRNLGGHVYFSCRSESSNKSLVVRPIWRS